jgi:hypothetical protein
MNTKQHFLLPRCTGMNCGATDANHSPECRAEHAAAVAGGQFVKDAALSARADGGKGEAVALWAAFAPEGNLLAHSKLRPGLSDILNWEPLYRTAPQAECAPREAQPISDAMMDLVDRLGSEASEVDPRAWKHLLVYAPERADAAPNPSDKQEAFAPRVYDDYGQNDPPVDLSSSADAEELWGIVRRLERGHDPKQCAQELRAAILAAKEKKS